MIAVGSCHRSPSASQGSAISELQEWIETSKTKGAPYTAFGKGGGQYARLVQTNPGGSLSLRRTLPDRHGFYPESDRALRYGNRWCMMMMMLVQSMQSLTYHNNEPPQAGHANISGSPTSCAVYPLQVQSTGDRNPVRLLPLGWNLCRKTQKGKCTGIRPQKLQGPGRMLRGSGRWGSTVPHCKSKETASSTLVTTFSGDETCVGSRCVLPAAGPVQCATE